MNAIKSLKICAKFGQDDQAVIIVDSQIPGMTENFPTASILSFRDDLIVKIELFYDGRRLTAKRDEIFR